MPDALKELEEKARKLEATPVQQVPSAPKVKDIPIEQPHVKTPLTPVLTDAPKHTYHSEFSMMALVLGILGLILPLFSTLAIVFGIGGLMQTHREELKGKWMAIIGIILGFLGIFMIIAAIIFGIEFLETLLIQFGGLETLMGKAQGYLGQ